MSAYVSIDIFTDISQKIVYQFHAGALLYIHGEQHLGERFTFTLSNITNSNPLKSFALPSKKWICGTPKTHYHFFSAIFTTFL